MSDAGLKPGATTANAPKCTGLKTGHYKTHGPKNWPRSKPYAAAARARARAIRFARCGKT
jgi:hypothetical protein